MDSYCLNFETSEILEGLKDKNNYIYDGNRKSWFKDHPEITLEIDEQLRKNFNIQNSRKLIFSIYKTEKINRLLKLHEMKENIINRIVISTSSRDFKNSKGKKFHFNSWEAYEIPRELIRKQADLYVDKSKDNTEDYVLIFEYVFNPNEFDSILENLDYMNFYS